MVKPNIQPATLEHAAYIAQRVREADKQELWASHLIDPYKAMRVGIRHSDFAFTGMDGDEPVLMYGVHRPCMLTPHGVPWMVGTGRLDEPLVAIAFLRLCRKPLVDFLEKFAILENYVDARNKRAIRWLKYMGFDVEKKAEPYGELGMPFHKFTMRRE